MADGPKAISIPGNFYELIAYFGSGILLVVLFGIGFLDHGAAQRMATVLGSLGSTVTVVLLFGALAVTYSYGQLASALSALLIGAPIHALTTTFAGRVSLDYSVDYSDIVRAAELESAIPSDKINNKWTLLFFLLATVPDVGNDLFKRYAREKLARINATNMLLLLVCCITVRIVDGLFYRSSDAGFTGLHVPSVGYMLFCAVMMVVFGYEYYKRRCWNNDLLVKVFPVAMYAARRSNAESKDRGQPS